MTQQRRGGDRKASAPAGYYTAAEAMRRLNIPKATFYYYRSQGKIHEVVPPLKSNGYYLKKEIDELAEATTLLLLQHMTEEQLAPTEFRVATPEDAEGIRAVILSLGWPATPAEKRRAWFKVNPMLDHVVVQDGVIMGYINTLPLKPAAMEGMLSGHKRGATVLPSDIYSFEPGKEYDLFCGLAERKDAKERGRYGMRLVLGFRRVLEEWARQGIIIHRLLAHSAEEDGQKLCAILGLEPLPAKPGDLYPRYGIDLFTSQHPFARQYREVLHGPPS